MSSISTVADLVNALPADGAPRKLVDVARGQLRGPLLKALRDAQRSGKVRVLMHDNDAAAARCLES